MSSLTDAVLPYLKVSIKGTDGAVVTELSEDDSPILDPFVGDLIVSYVVDEGDHLRYVANRELAGGPSLEVLRRAARRNLAEKVAERGARLMPTGEADATLVLFDGLLESTLMLCDELWPDVHAKLGREIFAVAPTRDVLTVGRAASIAGLRSIVRRVWRKGDHLLSQRVFRRVDGAGWSVHHPN